MIETCAVKGLSCTITVFGTLAQEHNNNANNKNGIKAAQILLQEGVKPEAITVGHLSDTDDLEYIKSIAQKGCFIGFDRLYDDCSCEYIEKMVNKIVTLCNWGYEDKIILSHDALHFNGFESNPLINETPRFSYCFKNILPRLTLEFANAVMTENPKNMLKCGG